MKLVVDINSVNSNVNTLSTEVEQFGSEASSFSSQTISCSLPEISGVIESYKSSIADDINKLNTSSNEFDTLVTECMSEYEANEANTKSISIEAIEQILSNYQDIAGGYEGSAAQRLTGLPSTELKGGTNVEAQKVVDKYSGRSLSDLSHDEFIEYIGAAAQLDYEQSGILPSVTMAQAICESGWGKHAIGNNIFGIKCGDSWTGKRINCKTGEQAANGSYYSINADFRDYDTLVEGITDHSNLLNKNLYKPVRQACDNNDAYEACRQLKACGYATSHSYADTLISIIDSNDLTRFDKK